VDCETYIAQDNQRPGKPLCVVKQLRLANHNPKHLQLARRLFNLEAETLEKLGNTTKFRNFFTLKKNEEFYLVQELIVGHPLSQELHPGKPILERAVIQILHDLLPTLNLSHENTAHIPIHKFHTTNYPCPKPTVQPPQLKGKATLPLALYPGLCTKRTMRWTCTIQ